MRKLLFPGLKFVSWGCCSDLLGTAVLAKGLGAAQMGTLIKILAALLISPVPGLIAGFLFRRVVIALSAPASPKVSGLFKRLQIFTSLSLALSHGSNDFQKTMELITRSPVTGGFQSSFRADPPGLSAPAQAPDISSRLKRTSSFPVSFSSTFLTIKSRWRGLAT